MAPGETPAISLRDLVGDLTAFERDHWGTTPMLRRTELELDHLLDVDGAERLLRASARRPTFRLVQDGATLPHHRSTSPVRMGGTRLADVADVAKVAEAVAGGATLVLQALQRTWPPLIDLCRRLELELSHPVQANAYLTPSGASGLAPHADEHDVLVLQVAGRKAWDADRLGTFTMTPGDVLYLPTGARHAAAAQHEPSLHLTIGILRVTYAQVVRRALRSLGDADLDRPLPIGFGRSERADALEAGVGEAVQRAARGLAALDPARIAAEERHRARTWRTPLGAGRLTAALAVDGIDLSTVVVAPADHEVQVDDAPAPDGRLVLHLRDRRLLIPSGARPALHRLLAGDAVKVGELPELSDASRVVLARRLVREGWLLVSAD